MSAATTKYEKADAQISKIIDAVKDPANLNVVFRSDDSRYDITVYYKGGFTDHTAERLIREFNFMIHPRSYNSDTVMVYELY